VLVRIRRLIGVTATVALGLIAGCGFIGGIEEITLVEADADADAGAGDADADAAATCALPSDGDAFLRMGVLAPEAESFDFCIKSTDASFDDVRPLLASSGPGCPAGLGYKDVTVAFRVAAGTYDVRMVPAGSQDCSASKGEVTGVEASDNRGMSVLAFAASGGYLLRALPESQIPFGHAQVRFVHGLLGYDELDCGATDSSRLPATIVTPVFRDVPFGGVAPSWEPVLGDIDENGYLLSSFAGGTLRFAFAPVGQTDALVTLATQYAPNSSHSLFAIGRKGDAAYPPSLWSCDESASLDGILASCGNPRDLSVEVFSTQLTDLFTPLYRERIEPVYDALEQDSSDVICVNEVRSPENLAALLAVTADAYPYRVAAIDLTLSESDLTDQSGSLPAPYDTPACTGDGATNLVALMDCVDKFCATDDGSGHHFINDGIAGADCVAKSCATPATPLVLYEEQHACWMCALTQMAAEETTEYVREACAEDPDTRYTYRGSVGLAVLSKHPIGDAKSWLLPSTGWQRGVIHAPIDLPNGVPLDFYCSDLSVPEEGILFPYVGHYGGDSQGNDQWEAEQLLQAQRLIKIIDENTGDSGARVVLGITAYAGPEYMQTLAAQSPEVYDTLTAAFAPLVPPGYEPSCTQCIDNPVFTGLASEDTPAADAWTSHLFGRGIPPEAIKSTDVTFRDAVYEVVAPEGTRMVPPSSQYGLRSVLRITQ
jgi:hypothetical protein